MRVGPRPALSVGVLRAFIRKRVRNDADVDDLVQRVFLQLHRGTRLVA